MSFFNKIFTNASGFKNLGNAFNDTYSRLDRVENRIINNSINDFDLNEELFNIAHFSKKEIINRMNEYSWYLSKPVSLKNIPFQKIIITSAFNITVDRLITISYTLPVSKEIE